MRREKPSWVYFVRRVDGEGPVKIGCSQCPPDRLRSLMAWTPYELEVAATTPGAEELEWRFHQRFAAQHLRREWFAPSAALSAVIEEVRAGTFDIAPLPPSKRLACAARATFRWTDLMKARASVNRRIERLRMAGVLVPIEVRRLAWGTHGLSDEDSWARVRTLESFVADHGPSDLSRQAKGRAA